MNMLHTVNKSPFEKSTLESCLRVVCDGSSVLLIEDGVYGALAHARSAPTVKGAMACVKFYALGPDVKARGLAPDQLIEGIELVDYGGYVDLAVNHDNVQAWL